jgi:hypothetical protein
VWADLLSVVPLGLGLLIWRRHSDAIAAHARDLPAAAGRSRVHGDGQGGR